jgi:hypothetical protein
MLQLPEWEVLPLTPPQPLSAPARQITQKDKRASFRCIMRRLRLKKYLPWNCSCPGGKIVRLRYEFDATRRGTGLPVPTALLEGSHTFCTCLFFGGRGKARSDDLGKGGFGCSWARCHYADGGPSISIDASGMAVRKYGIISDITHVLSVARTSFLTALWGIDKPKGNAILEASKVFSTSPLAGESPLSLTRKGNALSPRTL